MSDESIYKFSLNIAWQIEPVEKIVYILNNKNYEFTYFSDVGKDIWLLIEKQKNIREIVTLLSKKYSVKQEIIKKDIQDFIDDLLKKAVLIKND